MMAWHDRMTPSAMPSEEEAGFKIGQKPVPFKADMKAATVHWLTMKPATKPQKENGAR
jgi:hypothetical protein